MQPPFKIFFPTVSGNNKIIADKFHDDLKYKVSFADPELQVYDTGIFFTQSISGDDYCMQLWSFNVHQDGYFDWLISKPFIFVSVMLKGNLNSMQEGKNTLRLVSGTYNIHYLPVSAQRFLLNKGEYILLLIIPPVYYLRSMMTEHPGVAEIINRITDISSEVTSLETYTFPRRVLRIIKLLENTKTKGASLNLDLQKYILEIISHYNWQLAITNAGINKIRNSAEKAFLAKLFILANLGNTELCRLDSIANLLFSTPKTLGREFEKLTGKPVSVFIRHERLEWAKKLLENEKLTITEVASLVGYSESTNFTRAYKNKYGVLPYCKS